MGRYYRVAKNLTEEMVSEDNTKILVLTQEEQYPEVMTRIVNIFSRVGHGCELSFAGFAH